MRYPPSLSGFDLVVSLNGCVIYPGFDPADFLNDDGLARRDALLVLSTTFSSLDFFLLFFFLDGHEEVEG